MTACNYCLGITAIYHTATNSRECDDKLCEPSRPTGPGPHTDNHTHRWTDGNCQKVSFVEVLPTDSSSTRPSSNSI